MLTRGEAANTYDGIAKLLNEEDYYFHTVDGDDLHKGSFTYEEFLNKLPYFEYVDTTDPSYNKYYINPLIRILLITSATGTDKVEFTKLSFELIEFVYNQLHAAVDHGYRIALEDARKNVSNLFKEERSIDIV